MKWKGIGLLASTLAIGVAAPLVLRGFSKADPPIRATRVAVDPALQPRVATDSVRHSFGTMDVGEHGEHWFTIRNEGPGPLELRQGATSCSCTLSDLEGDRVPPGGLARVRLRWTPPKPAELFAQGATIHTNDPQKSSLYFSVVGEVRTHLGASPETVVFSSVPVGEQATGRFVVYSQAWDSFEVEARCPHPQVSVEMQPAEEAALARLESKCGYVVQLTLAPGLKPGLFHTEVKLAATSKTFEPARELTVQVTGQIAPSVWLEGANLVESNVLDLGTVPVGQGKKRSLALFVRGKEAEVKIGGVQVRPDALKVNVGPRERISEKLARYRIEVEIPKGAPTMACVGGLAGEIRFTTDHPEAPEMRLKVDFAILEAL